MSEFQDILMEKTDGIGRVILNRPQVRNAVRQQTMYEILIAVDELQEDPAVNAILISGNGPTFCAGADIAFLDALMDMGPHEIKNTIYKYFLGAVRKVALCPKPTVAALQGAAITVGCELAIACDFRIAAESVDLRETWIKVGLIPPLGGMFLLPRLIGLSKAREMVLTGRSVLAEEAERIGLVSRVVPDERLVEEALSFTRKLGRFPPLAYAMAKEGIRRGLESTLDREWAANLLAQSMLIKYDDFREGTAAIKDRRPPEFQGR
jgi:enoyl-CoA hydratase/carnithine racemase